MDNERRHYALDHHAGCVRPFTLATCEQAAVVVMMGLPLNEGEWHIYVNNPDLDALLASWILINHKRLLAHDKRLLRELMPLVRVEGVIDTHGLDMSELSALPSHIYKLHKARLDALRASEVSAKSHGRKNASRCCANRIRASTRSKRSSRRATGAHSASSSSIAATAT
jgi:hypothetical protein